MIGGNIKNFYYNLAIMFNLINPIMINKFIMFNLDNNKLLNKLLITYCRLIIIYFILIMIN